MHRAVAPGSFCHPRNALEMNRREWLRASLVGAASVFALRRLGAAGAPTAITVYKSPTCGCCASWVKHLSANGFAPVVHDVNDVSPMKRTMRVPEALWSCHT